MHIYKEGDVSRAACSFDKKLVTTTFRLRTVPFSSGKGEVEGVLAGVCDECDRVVAIPQQSVPRIRDAMRELKKPLEARLPVHLVDTFNLSCQKLGGSLKRKDVETPLISYYIHWLAHERNNKRVVTKLLGSDLAGGKLSDRLSMKIDASLHSASKNLATSLNLSMSDVIRALIVQMSHDILENETKRYQEIDHAFEVLLRTRDKVPA